MLANSQFDKFGLSAEKDENILITLRTFYVAQEKRYVVYISCGEKSIYKKSNNLNFFNFYQYKVYL